MAKPLTERYGSVDNALRSTKKTGSGLLYRLKPDSTVKVRFLQDPAEWERGYTHWLAGKFLWCGRGRDCPGCRTGDKPKELALANVVDLVAGKVVVMQLPTSLANSLAKRAKARRTLTDHDIDLSREGSTKENTKYGFDPDDRKRRNLDRYELHDIAAIVTAELEQQLDDIEHARAESEDEPRSTRKKSPSKKSSRYDDDEQEEDEDYDEDEEADDEEADEEEEDERPAPRRSSTKHRSGRVAVRRRPAHEDEDEEEDEEEDLEDEEEDDEYEPPRRSAVKKKSKSSGLDEFKPKKKSGTTRVVRRTAR